MPQNCQIIGANSVTNSDPGKGVMPVLFSKNADWFEKHTGSAFCDHCIVSLCHTVGRITDTQLNVCRSSYV